MSKARLLGVDAHFSSAGQYTFDGTPTDSWIMNGGTFCLLGVSLVPV